jgi:hypothetical protein
MRKDCKEVHYCYICGDSATTFQQIPDSVYRENLIPVASPTALVSVSRGRVAEVVEKEVARIVPVQPT